MKINFDRIFAIVSLVIGLSGLTGVGMLTTYRNDQRAEDIKVIKEVFVNMETGEPTPFTSRYMINPIINKAKENIEEAFRDTVKTQVLAAAMHLDVAELKANNEKALIIFKGLDSLGLSPQDVVNNYAKLKQEVIEDECVIIRGLYRMNTCDGEYTHRFTPDLGWRELYFSIPQGKKVCEPVYWYNDKKGRAIIDRSISRVVVHPC